MKKILLLVTLTIITLLQMIQNANAEKKVMKIAVLGGGSWGTAVARRIAINSAELPNCHNKIVMWLHQELVDGKDLAETINQLHENVKYLPGIKLPMHLMATNDISYAVDDADIILFAVPHQFLSSVLLKVQGNVRKCVIGVSLSKGIRIGPNGPELLSSLIKKTLGLHQVAVLMGANVASEATIAADNMDVAEGVARLLKCSCFNVDLSSDVATVELCGALKNVYSIGAGFCDSLGLGPSSKAAIIRQGLAEMAKFCQQYAPKSFQMETILLHSCGVADLVASAFGGRNRRCAAEFAQQAMQAAAVPTLAETEPLPDTKVGAGDNGGSGGVSGSVVSSAILWDQLEREILGGQKLQGLGTCDEVVALLASRSGESPGQASGSGSGSMSSISSGENDWRNDYPLLRRIHEIARLGADPRSLFQWSTL